MTLKVNDSGWLFQSGKMQNITKEVSLDEINDLLKFSDEDDAWAERVRQETVYHDKVLSGEIKDSNYHFDPLIDFFRMQNTEGTVTQYPFGYIITFLSRRHLWRGENQLYPHSESTLSRKTRGKSKESAELIHVISNMRISQFIKLIWKIHVVPYWEAKISEVNYKALAQHYGFDTYLLDLTNDFRTALFFATCKYENGSFHPLTDEDINSSESSKYGILFHTPDWTIDYMQTAGGFKWYSGYEKLRKENHYWPYVIDAGYMDGIAFQIGLQPFYRCHAQSGYVYPMKTEVPLQENPLFEKIKFRQSAKLSEYVFHLMHEGKDIYPEEGITAGEDILKQIQKNVVFSENDLEWAYNNNDCDKRIFPTIDSARKALNNEGIIIQKEDVDYHFKEEQLKRINDLYDNKPLLAPIGGRIHTTPEARKFREERFKQIFQAE